MFYLNEIFYFYATFIILLNVVFYLYVVFTTVHDTLERSFLTYSVIANICNHHKRIPFVFVSTNIYRTQQSIPSIAVFDCDTLFAADLLYHPQDQIHAQGCSHISFDIKLNALIQINLLNSPELKRVLILFEQRKRAMSEPSPLEAVDVKMLALKSPALSEGGRRKKLPFPLKKSYSTDANVTTPWYVHQCLLKHLIR